MKKLKCIKFSFLVCLNQVLSVWHLTLTLDSDISIVLAAFRINQVLPSLPLLAAAECWNQQLWVIQQEVRLTNFDFRKCAVCGRRAVSFCVASQFVHEATSEPHNHPSMSAEATWLTTLANRRNTDNHKSNDTLFVFFNIKWMITAKDLKVITKWSVRNLW